MDSSVVRLVAPCPYAGPTCWVCSRVSSVYAERRGTSARGAGACGGRVGTPRKSWADDEIASVCACVCVMDPGGRGAFNTVKGSSFR